MKRILYIVPPGPGALGGQIFRTDVYSPVPSLGGEFQKFFEEQGVELQTIDAWRKEDHSRENFLWVIGHPEDEWWVRPFYFLKYTLRGRKRFAMDWKELRPLIDLFPKNILYHVEVPINTPYPHRHLAKLTWLYKKVFLFLRPETVLPNVGYLMWPPNFREDCESLHGIPKTKFLTMVNSNARPSAFFQKELYSERLRAVKYFSERSDFDLYGGRWGKRPFFPYTFWSRYVRKVWHGPIEGDKLPVMAQYKFAIAFENSSYPGYVSEKLFDCLLSGAIPVYRGAPDVTEFVPEDCFIDMRKFENYSKLENYLRSLSEAELENYRARIRAYLIKEEHNIFSKRKFAEKIWNALN